MTVILVIIILGILIFVHELGHFLMAKWTNTRVDEFAIGFKPQLWAKKAGETLYAINAIPFGGYVKILGEDPDDPSSKTDPRSLYNKSTWQRIIILLGGVLFNFVFAWILITGLFTAGIPVGAETAAQNPDHAVEHSDGSYTLRLPVGQSIIRGSVLTYNISRDITVSFGNLIGGIFTGDSSVSELTGPVGLGEVVGQARETGFGQVIFLTAFISVNLAVLNLIPFPALDGGQLVITIIQGITGRKVKRSIVQWINVIGFFLLITLMIAVTVNDIIRLVN